MKITKSRLRQIIKEEMENVLSGGDPDSDADDAAELRDIADDLEGGSVEKIEATAMRAVRDADKRSFFSDTPQDLESVAAAMLGYRMVDHTNPAKIRTATQMADPKDVLLLGAAQGHIYFKTMDDTYYRIPR